MTDSIYMPRELKGWILWRLRTMPKSIKTNPKKVSLNDLLVDSTYSINTKPPELQAMLKQLIQEGIIFEPKKNTFMLTEYKGYDETEEYKAYHKGMNGTTEDFKNYMKIKENYVNEPIEKHQDKSDVKNQKPKPETKPEQKQDQTDDSDMFYLIGG